MSKLRADEMASIIKREIGRYQAEAAIDEVGSIIQVGDGIARVSGLSACMSGEMLEFGEGIFGLAMNLEEGSVGCIILGDYIRLAEGDEVRRTGRVIEVPVGQSLLGRVVDPLGRPVDGGGRLETTATRKIESPAPGLAERIGVCEPLQTGLKAIDSMTPVGCGQRELVIGDRKTGKTAICVDTIINQRETGVICVYVAIGQKESTVAGIYQLLKRTGAMDYSIIVSAPASVPAPMQFLAPYAGCAMAEHFMHTTWAHGSHGRPIREEGRFVRRPVEDGGRGLATFIAYDDLTKQADAFRQISLLLRRPPGREAYPGDVFYLHSRLLERAGKLGDEQGGGSLTAFPVVETQEGEVSAYIPTNVISITDGQIYLQPDLFNAGQRPAIDVGISVSRVGGAAQIRAMKQVAGTLRLELAAYRELEAFAQFGTDLDPSSQRQLERGARMMRLLRQPQGQPIDVIEQVAVLKGANEGLFDGFPVDDVPNCEAAFLEFLRASHDDLLAALRERGVFDKPGEEAFREALRTFLTSYKPGGRV